MPNVFRNKKVEDGLDESVRVTESSWATSEASQPVSGGHGNKRRRHPAAEENATAQRPLPPGLQETAATPDGIEAASSHDKEGAAATAGVAADVQNDDTYTKRPEAEDASPRDAEAADAGRVDKPAGGKRKNALGGVLGGDFLSRGWVRKQRGLLLLFVIFAIALVSNRYYVEHLTKEKLTTEENIKFLREQRIQMKRDYQDNVRISHIASQLDSVGIGIIAGPPYELGSLEKKKKR